MRRRDFLMTASVASLLPQTIARGQDAWPQRNITIVVPFLAGGSADLVARLFAQHLQVKRNISVVVENKARDAGSDQVDGCRIGCRVAVRIDARNRVFEANALATPANQLEDLLGIKLAVVEVTDRLEQGQLQLVDAARLDNGNREDDLMGNA